MQLKFSLAQTNIAHKHSCVDLMLLAASWDFANKFPHVHFLTGSENQEILVVREYPEIQRILFLPYRTLRRQRDQNQSMPYSCEIVIDHCYDYSNTSKLQNQEVMATKP